LTQKATTGCVIAVTSYGDRVSFEANFCSSQKIIRKFWT